MTDAIFQGAEGATRARPIWKPSIATAIVRPDTQVIPISTYDGVTDTVELHRDERLWLDMNGNLVGSEGFFYGQRAGHSLAFEQQIQTGKYNDGIASLQAAQQQQEQGFFSKLGFLR